MKNLLDDSMLDGSHAARITFRPEREAEPAALGDVPALRDLIADLCQVWGGANTPIVPVTADGTIHSAYARVLPGSQIDGLAGMDYLGLLREPLPKVKLVHERSGFGKQLAVALLKFRKQKKYAVLEIPELANDDPWRDIYAANLGLLPEVPSREILEHGHLVPDLRFDDFVRIKRPVILGSLEDLMDRLDERLSPRRLSMNGLAYGGVTHNGIRSEFHAIPQREFARMDAGPNIVVVCTPGSVEDIALLWNLRAAHGDTRPAPIGIPADTVSADKIRQLARHPHISHHGWGANVVYVTSASLSIDSLKNHIGKTDDRLYEFANQQDLLNLGYAAGWTRDEVLTWADGKTSYVPLHPDSHTSILNRRGFSDFTRVVADINLLSSPFPMGDDVRLDTFGSSFFAGAAHHDASLKRRSEASTLQWPSRMLMAKAVAGRRGLDLSESPPGIAARVALKGLSDLWEIGNLAHAPLLTLLEKMAARNGLSWYKRQRRSEPSDDELQRATAKTADDLPEMAFGQFKTALGNNEPATKYWLLWAERAGLIVKGFSLNCMICGAKQWTPVAAFSPPIVCRGCAQPLEEPFGDRHTATFMYRLSERLRRVYEHDAIGHLLVIRYFNSLMGAGSNSDLVGMHPGLDVRKHGSATTEGESDVLILLRSGDFVPVEVKRSYGSMTPLEVGKLDHLVALLRAPWSVLAVCQYGKDAPPEYLAYEQRGANEPPHRLVLSYDTLLDPRAVWGLGADPFAWSPLTAHQISDREKDFVNRLAQQAKDGDKDWMEWQLLRSAEDRVDALKEPGVTESTLTPAPDHKGAGAPSGAH
jgi:hypothetical protein